MVAVCGLVCVLMHVIAVLYPQVVFFIYTNSKLHRFCFKKKAVYISIKVVKATVVLLGTFRGVFEFNLIRPNLIPKTCTSEAQRELSSFKLSLYCI